MICEATVVKFRRAGTTLEFALHLPITGMVVQLKATGDWAYVQRSTRSTSLHYLHYLHYPSHPLTRVSHSASCLFRMTMRLI